MAIGDPFGSLDSSPDDWQDQEAQANLAAQNQPESGVSTLWRAIKHPSLLPLIKSLTSSDGTSAQPPQNVGDAAMAQYFPEAFTVNPVAQNLATGVAGAIKSGATAPGRALSGELPMYGPDGHTSEAMIDAGNDMAGLAGGASVAGTLEHAAARAPGADLRVLGRQVALAEDAAPGAAVSVAEHASEPFYSGLERAVTDTPQTKATGQQWLATLTNKPGVKTEEVERTGTREFLAANADKQVTRDQLLDHLEANKVQIGEKEYRAPPKFEDLNGAQEAHIIDAYRDREGVDPSRGEMQDIYDDMLQGKEVFGQPITRYQQYQLPGGENYREKLLKLPAKPDQFGIFNGEERVAPHMTFDTAQKAREWAGEAAYPNALEDAQIPRGSTVRQINDPQVYQSSHWPEDPNTFVHMRMNDRQVSGNGFTVQNQVSGRRSQVFPDQASANAYIEQLPESLQRQVNIVPAQDTKKALHLEELQSDWHQTGRKNGYRPDQEKQMADLVQQRDALTEQFHAMDPNDPARLDKIDEINKLHDQIADLGRSEPGVPDAPFRKTWHELGLKRALHEAAEGGYDRLSWTPGSDHPTNPKNLGSKGEAAEAADRGMQGFYDKMIPDYLNKVGKPHGVQVKQGTTGVGGWDDRLGKNVPPQPVHYIDINPSLRQHVLKGMPLFEDGKAGAVVSAAEHMPVGALEDPRLQDLTVNSILHPDTPAQKPRSRNVEDIGAELDKRGHAALKKLGVKGGQITEPNPVHDEMISRAMASEIKAAMDRGGNTAHDWYTQKVKEAMDTASELHPELKTDQNARMAFTAGLAITSQGETVTSNVRLANQVYNHYKQTGRFPTDVSADKQKMMNSSLGKLNALLDTLGPDGTREFLAKEFTVKELNKMGFKISGENVDTKVYGSAVLGPKIGQGFYQNLNGNYNPVTMDLWFMRAWNRLTGNLVGNPEAMPAATERLASAMQSEGLKVPKTPKAMRAAADQIMATHEKDYAANRALYKSKEKEKSEKVLAAERYQKNDTGLNEQPTGGAHRTWMRGHVARAREILASHGIHVTPADLQAIWWYPEKELYAKLGGRDAEKINTDYASAFRDLVGKVKGEGNDHVSQRPAPAGNVPPAGGSGLRAGADDARANARGGRGSAKGNGKAAAAPQVDFGALDAGGH